MAVESPLNDNVGVAEEIGIRVVSHFGNDIAAKLGVQQLRGHERLFDRRIAIEEVDICPDQISTIGGCDRGFGNYNGQDLTDESHLVGGEQRPGGQRVGGRRRSDRRQIEVGCRQHGDDAGHSLGLVGVYLVEYAVRDLATDGAQMERVFRLEIVHVATPARDEPRVLDALDVISEY